MTSHRARAGQVGLEDSWAEHPAREGDLSSVLKKLCCWEPSLCSSRWGGVLGEECPRADSVHSNHSFLPGYLGKLKMEYKQNLLHSRRMQL